MRLDFVVLERVLIRVGGEPAWLDVVVGADVLVRVSASASTVIAQAKPTIAGPPPPTCAATIAMHHAVPIAIDAAKSALVRRRPARNRSTKSWSTATANVFAAKTKPSPCAETPPVLVAYGGRAASYCE